MQLILNATDHGYFKRMRSIIGVQLPTLPPSPILQRLCYGELVQAGTELSEPIMKAILGTDTVHRCWV